jgi:AIG2-like family
VSAQLYFAYGSNLCVAQMAERCPSGQVVGRAMLPDHALIFPRRSVRRNCGVASITASPGSVVWGAVYRLTAADIAKLDASEGHVPTRDPGENAYNKHDVAVLRDGIPSGGITVFTYIAISMPGRHLPSADYRGLMIQGAYQHRLPRSYIAALEALEIA